MGRHAKHYDDESPPSSSNTDTGSSSDSDDEKAPIKVRPDLLLLLFSLLMELTNRLIMHEATSSAAIQTSRIREQPDLARTRDRGLCRRIACWSLLLLQEERIATFYQ